MTRERSVWGWGWADKFGDEETRGRLGQLVGALLQTELTPGNPSAPVLPAPRVDVPSALSAFSTTNDRAAHTYGKAFPDLVRGFQGDFSIAPDFVVHPDNETEISAVLDWAAGARVAVIPYGGGTTVVGGIEARFGDGQVGAISLDLRGLSGLKELDDVSRVALLRAGTLGPDVESALEPHGLTLRHFPQSFEFSTVGGWIATRAGGHYATLYTHIDDRVQSVRMLTPSGVFETRRFPASGAGPDPNRMVLGSEGILGVITEAWLRVVPKPTYRSKATVRFDRWADAVAATREMSQSGLHPANCRLLSAEEAMLFQVSMDGKHLLLIAFESADHPVDAWMVRALQITRARGGEGEPESASGGHWKNVFVEAPYFFGQLVSLGVLVDTFETACTWQNFDALHAAVTTDVKAKLTELCGGGILTCRFTHVYPDGPAPYYTFVAPTRPGAEVEHWTEIKKTAADAIVRTGGTITHHHAVGRTHRPWYDDERPEPFARALAAAKKELDPSGILNPGVLLSA